MKIENMDYEQKYKEALKWMQDLYSGLHGATKEEAEKYFPELKENEDEIRKDIISFLKGFEKDHYRSVNFNSWITWLEKQGEKRPTDKVESKFHEGEWIIINKTTYQITKIDNSHVVLSLNGIECHFELAVLDNAHLWTIKDAKDSDVLVGKDDRPFIFTGEFDVQDDNPTAYCGINSSDKFITGKGSHWAFKDGIKPATKEQRDLLFSKMKEEGYEWDSENKELKKIEVKKEVKQLDADKVIEWLKNTISETKEYFGRYGVYYNTRLSLPYNSIEDLVNDFKEDFGL